MGFVNNHLACLTGTWRNSQVWNEKLPQHPSWWIKHFDLARSHCPSKWLADCVFIFVPKWFFWSRHLLINLMCILSLQDNPPYDKGAFRIEIIFPAEYPFKPPKITFKTKIYHPNIDEKGQVCLPVISPENWKPATKTDQGIATLIVCTFVFRISVELTGLRASFIQM